MDLPSNEYTFHFSDIGERTKQKFEGSFTVKCLLSIEETIEVGLRLDAYNRGSTTLMNGLKFLNQAKAELEVRVVKSPSWWKDNGYGRDLKDANILLGVYNQALDAEKEYEKRLEEQAKKADETVKEAASKKKKD